MKNKLYTGLILMVLVFGMSLVIAQENSAEEVVVSGGNPSGSLGNVNTQLIKTQASVGNVGAINQTTKIPALVEPATKMCVVNAKLMKELDRLIDMLKEANESNDVQTISELKEKINLIKEKIREDTEECEETSVQEVRVSPGKPINVSTAKVSAISIRSNYVDRCAELNDWIEKKNFYENLYALSDEELKEKGYMNGKEDIEKILEELEEGINKIKIECEASTPISGGGGGQGVKVSQERYTVVKPGSIVITKPVVAESGREITDYYKLKVTNIMKKEENVEQQVKELKELRDEIDKLIKELIKSKDEINAEDMDELVAKIKIKPNKIKADNVVVNTVNKTIITKVNKKNLTIKPTNTQVIIKDKNFEIKTPGVNIENKTLKIGNSTIRLTASDIVEKIKVEPKEIELMEENAKPVYKIKVDENRKLLGFIPLKIEKDLTVDAGNTEVKILKEKRPWWSFLTIK